MFLSAITLGVAIVTFVVTGILRDRFPDSQARKLADNALILVVVYCAFEAFIKEIRKVMEPHVV